MTTPRQRHAELCRTIAEHDHRYYVLDEPSVSDAEYDKLFRELRAIESEHPELVTPASPTQRVGAAPREGVEKVQHAHKMYSLDNAYTPEDLLEFDRRVRDGLRASETPRYVTEPKIDGASIEIVYRDGLLVLGATRGDGAVGEDVTANVRTIRGLPLTIAERRELTLRGEVVIHTDDFEALNEERVAAGEEPFSNPRNAASGWLRLLDPRLVADRPLRVLLYEVVERRYDSHHLALAAISELGLPSHRREHVCEDIAGVQAFVERFEKERRKLPYDTDGIVIKVDSYEQRDRLGATARFPRWATAFKYAAEQAETRVRAITCEVGRTGALTPVADLEPVQLSGTIVSRASLHNLDQVAAKDVRVGDTVLIEKAGEIIPQVVSVRPEKRPRGASPWKPPTKCPACGEPVSRVEGLAALRCTNAACSGRLEASVFYFTRRHAMDVDRLGASLIAQLVSARLVTDLADIFALPSKREALLGLERMGEKSVDNLLASVEIARTGRTFDRLLTGLGIPLVGGVAAKLLAARYRDLGTMLGVAPEAMRADLDEIHGIGPKIAESVSAFFADATQRETMKRLLALGVVAVQPEEQKPTSGPLLGKTFCVTGVLSRPREEIHAAIRAAGGEVHDRVKKGTSFLVVGEKVGASKLEAAKKHGTQVVTEPDLEAMLRG